MSTYRRIDAVTKAGEIIKFLGLQKGPVTGPEVAQALGMQVGTVMCHLATLDDLGFIRQVGDGWEIGLGLGLIYHKVKANLVAQRERIDRDINSLGGM